MQIMNIMQMFRIIQQWKKCVVIHSIIEFLWMVTQDERWITVMTSTISFVMNRLVSFTCCKKTDENRILSHIQMKRQKPRLTVLHYYKYNNDWVCGDAYEKLLLQISQIFIILINTLSGKKFPLSKTNTSLFSNYNLNFQFPMNIFTIFLQHSSSNFQLHITAVTLRSFHWS